MNLWKTYMQQIRKRNNGKLPEEDNKAGKTVNASIPSIRIKGFSYGVKKSPKQQESSSRKDPPPLDLGFWSFLTFLHHGIEKVERHLLWKFHESIQRKRWSNVPPKLLACIGFLYKVVHKNGRLRKFNRSREIEFNFFTAWTTFMKLGTLVHHVHSYKTMPQNF